MKEMKSVEQLMRLTTIQTAITFLSCAILFWPSLLFPLILLEILPFFILFAVFNIAYNESRKTLKIVAILLFIVAYYIMALYASYWFFDLFLVVIISSSILAHSHVKHADGNKKEYARMLMPVFVTIVQIVFIVILSDYYKGIYDNEGNFPSVYRSTWNHYEFMGASLFLVTSLIANFAVLIWNRWWFLLIMGVGMIGFSSWFFWYSEFFVIKVPSVIALVYAFGIVITNLMNLVFSGFDFRVWLKKICCRS